MPRYDEGYETPKWRTFWLLIGFAGLVAIGVVTVVWPELEDEPSEDASAEVDSKQGSEGDAPSQR